MIAEAGDRFELDLLGVAMLDPAITAKVNIEPHHFVDGRHGVIWSAIRSIHSDGLVVEPTLILQRCNGARIDPAIFPELAGRGVAANVDEYVTGIRGQYARRTLADRLATAQQQLANGVDVDPAAVLADLPAATDADRPHVITPIDWHELFADDTEEEFILYPLIPERRHVALYSEAKIGKSLLMLEIAAAVSRGRNVLGQPTRRKRVLYVDFENDPRGDIRTRLEDMGYGPDDLGELIYLSFPTMAALNTYEGGRQLLDNAVGHSCGLVVIDTVSRAIDGEENSNDTWLGLYAHTGLKLKQAGIAMVRLDHSGKDTSKGQRGGSAKTGDVDAVWQLAKISDDTFKLECSHHRFMLAADDTVLTLYRREDPLRHDVNHGAVAVYDAKVAAVLADLDRLDIPSDWGRDRVRKRFREAGIKHGNSAIAKALRTRQNLSGTGPIAGTAQPVLDHSGQVTGSTPENLSGTGPGQVGTAYREAPVPAPRSIGRDRSDAGQIPACQVCGKPLPESAIADGFNTHAGCETAA